MDLLYRIVHKPHLQNLCKPPFIHLWEAHSFPRYCVLASSHINMLCCVALITILVFVIPGGRIFGLANMISVTCLLQVLSSCVTWKKSLELGSPGSKLASPLAGSVDK